MDLKSLKVFVEVVECQSFSLAADHLCMTQPTLSKSLSQLEAELETALFKRGEAGRKRDVELTYTGELIYQHALNMLQEQQKIYATLDQVKNLQYGKLTLGLPPVCSVLLSPLIALFHQQYPEIQLNFLEVGALGIEQAIADKSIDVGILLENFRPNFQAIPVLDSPMCLITSHQSKWQNQHTVALHALKDESFLFYSDTFRLNHRIIQACRLAGFEPKVVCKSSQWDFIARMVALNMGVALLPEIYCQQLDPSELHMATLQDSDLHWTLSMAWNTSVAMSPATRAWLNIVEQHKDQLFTFKK